MMKVFIIGQEVRELEYKEIGCMAELADAGDLKSPDRNDRPGSTPGMAISNILKRTNND